MKGAVTGNADSADVQAALLRTELAPDEPKSSSRRLRTTRTEAPNQRHVAGRRLRIDSRRRWFPELREAFGSRELLVLLSKRQITVSYRQTVLGPVWVFLSPLLSAGLFTFVFGSVAHLSSGGDSYFAFSYAGLLSWNVFASTLTGASTSLNSNSALISKIYFPRVILPLTALAPMLIQTTLSTGVMAILLVAYGIGFSVHLLLLPFWLLLALALAIGVSLILGSLSVSYRDINNLTPALIPLFMYLSPVAYSPASIPASLQTVYLLNPVATIVEGARWSLLGHGEVHAWALAYTIGLTIAFVVAGLAVFARLERGFADVI